MANKSPFLKGYNDGITNKPRANNYPEFSSAWKAYEKGYKSGERARN